MTEPDPKPGQSQEPKPGSGLLTVAAGEAGLVRIFALDMPPQRAEFLREPGAADQVLGVAGLDPAQIDIIRIRDLEDLGLAGYLAEGLGIPAPEIDRARPALDALEGWVMVLRSRAFGGRAATLSPDPALRPVALLREAGTDWRADPLRAESARPHSAPPLPPRRARAAARRTGGAIFAVVMALIALALWALLT